MPVPSLPLPLPQFFIGILKETQESKLLTALEIRITAQTTVGFKDDFSSLTGVAQLVGTLFHKTKRHRFDFQSGHTPRLRVQSPVGACIGRWPIHASLSHRCFFLSEHNEKMSSGPGWCGSVD